MKPMKSHHWWGVTYSNGKDVMPDTIRRTRREARHACTTVGNRDWKFWHKNGCRDVRVTVFVEDSECN